MTVYPNVFNGYAGSVSAWTSNGVAFPAWVVKNLGSSMTSDGATEYEPGQLQLHANAGLASVVRLTIPATDTYVFDGIFTNKSYSFSGTQVYIYHNSTQLYADTLGGFNSFAFTSNFTMPLNAGDFIDFIVGPRSDGSFNSTSTGLIAYYSVAAVPEPATMLLIGTAITGGLAGWRIRRARLRREEEMRLDV